MFVDQQPRVTVGAGDPIVRPFVRVELSLVWNVEEIDGVSGLGIKARSGFLMEPHEVVPIGCAHARLIRTWLLEAGVAPVSRAKAGNLGMIVLRDHHERTIRLMSYDHCRISGRIPDFELSLADTTHRIGLDIHRSCRNRVVAHAVGPILIDNGGALSEDT